MLVETSPAFEEVDLLSNQIIADTTSTYFTRTTSIITEHQLVIYNYKNITHGNDNESIFNIILFYNMFEEVDLRWKPVNYFRFLSDDK